MHTEDRTHQVQTEGPVNLFDGVPRRRRSASLIRRHRSPQIRNVHTEGSNSEFVNESSATPHQGINHVGRARQTSHLPTIPEEHSATTSLNQGRMRVPRGWERTQLTPLPRFTTDHSTYEHGSTSGSTNVYTNEECGQNSNREGQAEAAPLFEGQANHMESDTRPYVNITRYNCARDFHEYQGIPRSQLSAPTTCRHCYARLFLHEQLNCVVNLGKLFFLPYQLHLR